MDGLYNETLSEMTCPAVVTLSRGTIEIFTRMLFVRNKTLTTLCFAVKEHTKLQKHEGSCREKKPQTVGDCFPLLLEWPRHFLSYS